MEEASGSAAGRCMRYAEESVMKRMMVVMTAGGELCVRKWTPVHDRLRPDRRPPPVANRQYLIEQIDEAAVVQLYADGFEALPLKEKTLIWHLYEAALAGRDIYYDQRYEHALEMRGVLEAILTHPAKASIRKRSKRSFAIRSCSGSTAARSTTSPPGSSSCAARRKRSPPRRTPPKAPERPFRSAAARRSTGRSRG